MQGNFFGREDVFGKGMSSAERNFSEGGGASFGGGNVFGRGNVLAGVNVLTGRNVVSGEIS